MAAAAINVIIAMEEMEAKAIANMIQKHEEVSMDMWNMVSTMNEPDMYPEVRVFMEKCVNDVSLLLDQMVAHIVEAQKLHEKNIKANGKKMLKLAKIK